MAETNRQAKIQLLSEWESERDELNRLISRLRRDLGLTASENPNIPDAPSQQSYEGMSANVVDLVQPGDFFGMSQVAATRSFLQRTNKRPASLQDIAIALHRGKATDVLLTGTALRNLSSALSHAGDLISVAKGRWGLVEWYPGKVKKAKNKEDSDSNNSTGTKPIETDR
jgi:hypothetical protein